MMDLDAAGTYVLLMRLAQPAAMVVGGLGALRFRAGFYLYVGSALGGLRPRLARHLRADKRHHWHVDYMLDVATIEEIWVAKGPERRECRWAGALASLGGVCRLHPGFGASDCRCGGHLFYSPARPCASWLAEALPTEGIAVVRPPLP